MLIASTFDLKIGRLLNQDATKVGVSRRFGELENGRGLTREIVPADHYGSPPYIPDPTPSSEVEISFQAERNFKSDGTRYLYPKVNQRQGAEVCLISLKIAGDGVAIGAKMFIVQGKPYEPEGMTKDTRKDALETANEFLNRGFPFVTIVGDGRVYTVEEFALTIINGAR